MGTQAVARELQMPTPYRDATPAFEYLTLDRMLFLRDRTLAAGTNFRVSSKPWLASLALQKKTGNWQPSPMPIVLSPDLHVIDGLHRIISDIECGVPGRWYLVVSNWPSELDKGIDRNRSRTALEALRFHHPDWGMNHGKKATIRAAIFGLAESPAVSRLTDSDYEEAYAALDPQLNIISTWFAGKQTSVTSGVRAAFVRASSHVEMTDLEYAAQIFRQQIPATTHQKRFDTMTHLGRVMRDQRFRRKQGSHATPEQYGKTASALVAFNEGRILTKFGMPSEEPFTNASLDAIRDDILTR